MNNPVPRNISATAGRRHVAIACGGTGGHLFPRRAMADEFLRLNCDVTLLISPKEVDQQAVKAARGMEVVVLPAVALTRGTFVRFCGGFLKSYAAARRLFRRRAPQAVLAMGGFTSAPPVLAGRHGGAKTFLHEANTLPGRANRWLSHFVDEAFVYFHEASGCLNLQSVHVAGMPLRQSFHDPIEPAAARMSLGLNPHNPVLLVMGGSQGARAINEATVAALPRLLHSLPDLQFIHLTGTLDFDKVRAAYRSMNLRPVVRPFLTEMDLALGAATLAVSRAGASSLAEFAAMRLPPLLIPYPTAADNHQFYNAAAFADAGAAQMIEQSRLTPESLAQRIVELLQAAEGRERMQQALAQWYLPDAASRIARHILARIIGGASILDAPSEGEAASATHPSFSKIALSHPVEL